MKLVADSLTIPGGFGLARVEGAEVIACRDEHGVLFLAPWEVAALTPEWPGRCRVVASDGSVAYCAEMPELGLAELGASRVNPKLLLKLGPRLWRDPADFVHSGAVLAEAPVWPESEAREILGVRTDGKGGSVWLTEAGEQPEDIALVQAAARYPELMQATRNLYFNRQRLRRLRFRDRQCDLVLNDGRVLETIAHESGVDLALELGQDQVAEVVGAELGLRDWPCELALASVEWLRAHFSALKPLLGNLMYQAVLYHARGLATTYGRTQRGFYYRPIYSTAYRCGFVKRKRARWVELESEVRSADDQLCLDYGRLLNVLTGDLRLFTFAQLGFKDVGRGLRRIGKKRPEVILLVEKESLLDDARKLARKFGISYLVTGGYPRLQATEFFVAALRQAGVNGPVRVVAMVDFDPDGWLLAEALLAQLGRYGVNFSHPLEFLVRPCHFTPEELELFAMPCDNPDSTKVKKWLEKSGGVGGRAFGIHANHLTPVERLISPLEALL